jgi:hypothetical protein
LIRIGLIYNFHQMRDRLFRTEDLPLPGCLAERLREPGADGTRMQANAQSRWMRAPQFDAWRFDKLIESGLTRPVAVPTSKMGI